MVSQTYFIRLNVVVFLRGIELAWLIEERRKKFHPTTSHLGRVERSKLVAWAEKRKRGEMAALNWCKL